MFHCFKTFQCVSCNNNFCNRAVNYYKENPRTHSLSSFPRILKCSHSICEGCAQNAISQYKRIVCTKCEHCTEFDDDEVSVTKMLPDLHVLGILSANQKQISSVQVQVASAATFIEKPCAVNEVTQILCAECLLQEALWNCVKCEEYFCNACFDQVHNRGVKSMRKHVKKALENLKYNTLIKNTCAEHNKEIEFYCEEDDELACSYCCVTGKHKGHEVMTLVEKNGTCKEELKSALAEVLLIRKIMKRTEMKLAEIIPTERRDYSAVIKDVHDTFHELHSLLQLREIQLISEVEATSNNRVLPLENMQQELQCHQTTVENLICDTEKALKNSKLPISYPSLIERLKECRNLPHHLNSVGDEEKLELEIEVNFDVDLPHILSTYGSVSGKTCQKYNLKRTAELPQDYVIEDIGNASSVADTESVTSKSEVASEDGLSITPTSPLGSVASLTTLKHPQFSISQPERVIVSHIRDPEKFYVQRCSESRKLKTMSDAINKFCKSTEANKSIPVNITKGDLYLVQYSTDKKWYRGRVKKFILSDTSDNNVMNKENFVENEETRFVCMDDTDSLSELETISSNGEIQKVEVLYIDYGNTEIVSVSSLRNIQTRFLNLAGIAKECCLYDIYPKVKDKWTDDAVKMFVKFVGNKEVVMMVAEERNGIYYVDLTQSATSEIANDVPVSVRDALVFLEHGYFTENKSPTNAASKISRKFLPQEKLGPGVQKQVILSHVENPSLFYIQQISSASKLSSLINEMNATYKAEIQNSLHRIYIPFIGMICTAQYSVDKKWYRAEVLGLPGGPMIEVQYIDFGNTEVLHHKYLRKLFDRFNKLNVQAIKCSLADVVPIGQDKWPVEAKSWLMKVCSRKQLLLKSLGILPEDLKTEVVLFDVHDDVDICINALMVEEAIASSSGKRSLQVRIDKPALLRPLASSVAIQPVESTSSFCGKEICESSEPNIQMEESDPKPKQECKNILIPIRITHIESPGLFWIRLIAPEYKETKFNKFVESIQCAYEHDANIIDSAKVGHVYAALSTMDNKWYRGSVSEANTSTVKMLFSDYGRVEEVPIKSLRQLRAEFKGEMAFALKCHLAEIQPAGDSRDWTQIACESFQELCYSRDFMYLIKKGETVQKSIPSDVLYKELRRGGALEADEILYVSIIDKLCEKGVALRPRRSCSVMPQPVEKPEGLKKETAVFPVSEGKVIKKRQLQPIVHWKPVEYVEDCVFEAMVTYVEHGGFIHLHPMQKGAESIAFIQKTLKYHCSKDYESLTVPPAIGQACLAKFCIDQQWHRAEVISHTEKFIKVVFVDYGNIENVKLEDIYSDVILGEVPRQAIDCQLHNIKPKKHGGTWSIEILDYLHSLIVEQQCLVEIQEHPETGKPLQIKLTMKRDKIDVGQLLISLGEAVNISSSSMPLESCERSVLSDTMDNEALLLSAFKKASPLRKGDPFQVCVTQMVQPNLVFLQQLEITGPTTEYDKIRNAEYSEFLSMMEKLDSLADFFPSVETPELGVPYCAKYTFDDQWYRCEVSKILEDGVSVLYIDYGNTEDIAVERLRKLEGHFVDFPMQSHVCKLHNIEPIEDEFSTEAVNSMIECLFKNDNPIYARVIELGGVSEVELLGCPDDETNWNLIYQDIIDKNIIKLC